MENDYIYSGHKHNYERTYPMRNNTKVTTLFHNPESFFQVITGNHGNYEGIDTFNDNDILPDWSAHRFQGYGFTSIEIAPNFLNIHHHEINLDASLGRLVDHIRVLKTPGHINKQKIIY